MIKPNPEVDVIVAAATALAKKHQHCYVTIEHIALSLIQYKPFKKLLTDFGVDTKGLSQDLNDYVAGQTVLVNPSVAGQDPRKTTGVERVFNRALTQLLFSGRDTMQIVDLFVSLSVEHTSYASYFFLKYGLDPCTR